MIETPLLVSRGGGVFISVKRNIIVEPITINDNNLEQIVIKIKVFGGDIIWDVLIPIQSHIDVYSSHL